MKIEELFASLCMVSSAEVKTREGTTVTVECSLEEQAMVGIDYYDALSSLNAVLKSVGFGLVLHSMAPVYKLSAIMNVDGEMKRVHLMRGIIYRTNVEVPGAIKVITFGKTEYLIVRLMDVSCIVKTIFDIDVEPFGPIRYIKGYHDNVVVMPAFKITMDKCLPHTILLKGAGIIFKRYLVPAYSVAYFLRKVQEKLNEVKECRNDIKVYSLAVKAYIMIEILMRRKARLEKIAKAKKKSEYSRSAHRMIKQIDRIIEYIESCKIKRKKRKRKLSALDPHVVGDDDK